MKRVWLTLSTNVPRHEEHAGSGTYRQVQANSLAIDVILTMSGLISAWHWNVRLSHRGVLEHNWYWLHGKTIKVLRKTLCSKQTNVVKREGKWCYESEEILDSPNPRDITPLTNRLFQTLTLPYGSRPSETSMSWIRLLSLKACSEYSLGQYLNHKAIASINRS